MLAEFSVVPIGRGEHVGEYIAEALKAVDESGLEYRFHAMGTSVEGSWDEVMPLIRRCHEAVARRANRVYTIIKIDDFKGRTGTLKSKVASVEARVGRKLKTE